MKTLGLYYKHEERGKVGEKTDLTLNGEPLFVGDLIYCNNCDYELVVKDKEECFVMGYRQACLKNKEISKIDILFKKISSYVELKDKRGYGLIIVRELKKIIKNKQIKNVEINNEAVIVTMHECFEHTYTTVKLITGEKGQTYNKGRDIYNEATGIYVAYLKAKNKQLKNKIAQFQAVMDFNIKELQEINNLNYEIKNNYNYDVNGIRNIINII
jgi:hypothetical protein